MAVTQNTYTGDGTTVLFSFTFPYLETTDIKVSVNGTNTTAYTLANATTIQFNTAPANGAAIRIYRQTDDTALAATFYPGSAIRSADLNENFTQNLYVTQESNNISATATTTANTALTNSNTAISTANSAVSTANTASTNASAAVATANTASTNASAAVSTANTASTNATAAVNTANTASTNASNSVTTANTALSTANTASTNASAAVATANTASSNASAAVSTANTASSNATTAVNTANNALSTANAAQSTANTADANANAALNAIAGTVQYVLVANVAAIPSSPGNGDAIEIADSTGIESFSPLTNRPAGFVGDSGLSVRLQYLSAGSSWNWLNYFANNSETRYLKFGGGTITGNLEIGNSGSLSFEGSTANAFETTLAVTDPTADRTITLPDVSGTVVTTGDTGSVTSTMIADGTILNADVNASAAIAGTKISPDFGSQNVTTTGTVTGASLNPTSSTVPTNGVYLPAANTVGISTGGSQRLNIDANGRLNVAANSQGIRFGTQANISAAEGAELILNNLGAQPIAFYTNNSERLRITSAGFVGIGTSSPASLLHSVGTTILGTGTYPTGSIGLSDARTAILSSTENQILVIGNTNATVGADKGAEIYLGAKATTGSENLAFAKIGGFKSNATSGNFESHLTFNTSNSVGTSSEKVRIDSSGRVGIGTTAPIAQTHIRLSAVTGYTSPSNDGFVLERGGGNDVAISIATDNTRNGYLIFADGDSANPAWVGYDHSANAMSFRVNASERARIDSSGRLLVGTSSYSFAATAVLQGNSSASNEDAALRMNRGGTPGANADLGLITFGDNAGNIGATIRATNDTASSWGSGDYPGRLTFSTTADGASSPTERMRIQSTGKTTIFAASGQNVIGVHTASAAGTTDYAFYVGSSATSTTAFSATNLGIFTNGNVVNTNNSYGAISDVKLKENIVDAASQWDDIKALQVRKYNFKEGQTHTQIGLVAQEVELVSPGLVSESPDRDAEGNDLGTVTKSVNYSVLYMKAVKALQEAMERIETLEARLTAAGL